MPPNHPLPLIIINRAQLDRTAELLASFATARKAEGVVYWFGIETAGCAFVTTLAVPDADTRFGYVHTSAEANAQVLAAMADTPLILIGQAHSHPAHKVRHSTFDDQHTFARHEGALSVVVPYFGQRGLTLNRCGIHRFINGQFRLLKRAELPQQLLVLPGELDFRVRETTKG